MTSPMASLMMTISTLRHRVQLLPTDRTMVTGPDQSESVALAEDL